MPKKVERALKKQCKKKGLKGRKCDRLVYGTMRKQGWKPKTQRRHTGRGR